MISVEELMIIKTRVQQFNIQDLDLHIMASVQLKG